MRPARRSRRFACAVLLGLLASTVAAGAQTGGPVADGEFTGSISVAGGFTVNIEIEGATGAITVLAEGDGPLQITLEAGQMTGTWSIVNGVQNVGGTITGSSSGQTVNITILGMGTLNGSGTMVGPPTNYRLQGSITQSNTVNVDVAGLFSQSNTSTDTVQLDSPLTDVIVLCQDIVGRWDLQVRQQIAAADAAVPQASFDEFVRGYFTASTGVDATEQAEEVEELISAVSSWAGEAGSIESGDRSLYIGRGLAMLDQAQQLQAELAADSPCPPDPTFATQLTLAAQDALNTLIDRFPGITNTTLVAFATGAGAIGAGSASPDAAEALQAKMEADVSDKFDEFLADWPDGTTDEDLANVARTAQALGMETLGDDDLTPTDFLLVLTGSSE